MKRHRSTAYKKRRRGILYLLIGALILVYLTFGRYGLVSIFKMERKERNLRKRASELEAQKTILEENIKRILSDKKEVERLARTKLSMIKKGEKLIIIKEVK